MRLTAGCSLAMLLGVALLTQQALGAPGDTTLVSEADPSILSIAASGRSGPFSVSGDGRYAVFSSDGNLVVGDTNRRDDVFLRDRQTNTTTRVSVDSSGAQSNGFSDSAAISADGRFVTFHSDASNLAPGDTNSSLDVFVRDRQANTTTRVSVDSSGVQSNGDSYAPAISADGRYVTFYSDASNLVAGDSNGTFDVFVRDRQTNTTTRVSADSSGVQSNGDSYAPAISADGRFVTFRSDASNLVAGDSNGTFDVFVRDRQTNTTTRVSVDSSGVQSNGDSYYPAISADGRYVTFFSGASNLVAGDSSGTFDVFVRDRHTNTTTRVSVDNNGAESNRFSLNPAISADGRYVTFVSAASNLAPGDTNSSLDVFVRDRQANTTTRVSVDSDGEQGNRDSFSSAISGDGRVVTFSSFASNLVAGDINGTFDVFVRDRQANTTDIVSEVDPSILSIAASGRSWRFAISGDGRYVAFQSFASNLVAGDTNQWDDVFLRDRQTNTTTRVSVDSDGEQGKRESFSSAISADGRYVTFVSMSKLVVGDTNNTPDVFVRDGQTNTTTRVSVDSSGAQSNGFSDVPAISADGRYVTFFSYASNLVVGDTNGVPDVFVRDRQTNTTTRVSVDSSGVQSNGDSYAPAISADGRYVTFYSGASNLVAGDSNGTFDVFVRDRQTNTTTRVSADSSGVQSNGDSYFPAISADGRYVTFRSGASNLVAGDSNFTFDVFVRDRQTNTTTRVSVDSSGAQGNNISDTPAISADGRFVTFTSLASDLVAGDTNGTYDVFVRDRHTDTTTRVSVDSSGAQSNGTSDAPAISADGRFVTFTSLASDLVAGDPNGTYDVFVHETNAAAAILYEFSGFFRPVDNRPTRNTVKAGAAIPVKFSLNGNQGLAILAAGYPASRSLQCATNAPIDAATRTVTAGNSGLSYDASADQYTYVWKTDKAWANSCRRLLVRLNDGSLHTADFGFLK